MTYKLFNYKRSLDKNQKKDGFTRGTYINDNNEIIKFRLNTKAYNKGIKQLNIKTKILKMQNVINRMKNEIKKERKPRKKTETKFNKIIKDNYIYANIIVTGIFKVSKTTIKRLININQYLNTSKYNVMTLDADIIKGCLIYGENFGAKFITYEKERIDKLTTRQINILLNQRMRKASNIDNIANLYNHSVDLNNKNKCCVLDILLTSYKKFYTNDSIMKKLNKITGFTKYEHYQQHGISCFDLITLCDMCKIGLYIYDVDANPIYIKLTQNTKKNLIIITHNNHMYLCKNKTLQRQRIKQANTEDHKYIFESKDDVKKSLLEKINNNECINYVNITKNYEISGFISNDVYYLMKDPNHDNINNILYKYGLLELNKNHQINTNNIFSTIEKLYLNQNIDYFLPIMFTIPPVHYSCENKYFNNNKHVIKIDKNKCYASACASLPYLITADYMLCDITKCNNDVVLIDYHYYLITPHVTQKNNLWFVLIDEKSNIYNGLYIRMLRKNNISFDIIEEMRTEKIANHYTQLFIDMFTDTSKFSKEELKILKLGYCVQFEKENRSINYKDKIQYNNINSSVTNDGYDIKLSDTVNINYSIIEKINVDFKNRKLINNQIKTQSRETLYNKIIELNLELNDIIEINTDSITFYYNKNKHIYNTNEYNNNKFYGWKEESEDIMDNEFKITYKKNNISESLEIATLQTQIMNIKNSTLNIGYAGSGKSYLIEEEIKKNKLHQIITPNHYLNSAYKNKILNSNVIQYYIYNDKKLLDIDKSTIIYIDEIGLYDKASWEVIIKLILLNYTVKAYGDFHQISPWDSKDGTGYDKKHFINTMFYNVNILNNNARNTFSKSYYNSLIQSNDKETLYKEILKYSESDYTKAKLIISYYKQTCIYYNEIMLLHLYGNSDKFTNIGEKMICVTNELRTIDIYNNSILYIEKLDNEYTYIKHLNDDKIYKLKHSQIKANFKNAYCLNINKIQGQSIDSYYFADIKDYHHMIQENDKKQLCKNMINSKIAYTIISRLTKPYEQVKKHWENNNFDDATDMNKKYIQDIYKRDIQNIKIRYNGDIKNDNNYNNDENNDTWDDMFN